MGLPPLGEINDFDAHGKTFAHIIDFVRELDLSGDRYALIEVNRPITKQMAEALKESLARVIGEEKGNRIMVLSEGVHIWHATEEELGNILAARGATVAIRGPMHDA